MNFQNLQSPVEDKYKNFHLTPNIEKTNLFPPNEINSPLLIENNLIEENQNPNNINNNMKNMNPISIASLIQENENLSRALKKEIIKNEEQRNYIQVLKETIESNLFRSGFSEILASSKEYQQFQEFNKGQGKTMADFIVDFIKFKEETNKFKKDLLTSNNIISDSKNEIDNLNII